MRKSVLRRPSPALVVSFVALLVAMGGTAYAGLSVPKNSVGTKQLKNGAVTTFKLKNGAVTAAKLNVNGVTVPNAMHAKIADSATNATNATNAMHATKASDLNGAGWGLVYFGVSPTLTRGHNASITHPATGQWCISVPGADPSTTPIALTNEFDSDGTFIDPMSGSSSGVEWDATQHFSEGCPANQYAVITYSIGRGSGPGLKTILIDGSFSFFVP